MTLRRLGARIVLARRFPDHHAFTSDDLAEVVREAQGRGAELVVTTQKDAARIAPERWRDLGGPPAFVLRGEFALRGHEADFWEIVKAALAGAASGAR